MKYLQIFEEFIGNKDLTKSEVSSLLNDLSNLLKGQGLVIDYKINDREDIEISIDIKYDNPLEGFDNLSLDEKVIQYRKSFLDISKVIDRFLIKWKERMNKVNLMLLDRKYIWGSKSSIENINDFTYLSQSWDKGLMAIDLVIKGKKFQRVKPTDKVLHFSYRKNREFIEENGIKMTNNEKWAGGSKLDIGGLGYGIDESAVYAIQDFRDVSGFDNVNGLIVRLFGGYNDIMMHIEDLGWSREDVMIDLWEIDTKGLGYRWYRDSNMEFSDSIKSKTEYDWIMSFDGDIPKERIRLIETINPI